LSNKLCIISEYNPFHLGHLYHLEQSISKSKSDFKIAIVSGNFVQRGEPSIINKWEKAKCALLAGFDLVVELPVLYAISSAENFANGAIKIAKMLSADYLSFGSESGDIEKLEELTTLVNENNEIYIKKVKQKISEGFSYPKSQELVIDELFGADFKNICSPNNILGFEYLKSIKALSANITPITIKRDLSKSSSSNIRTLIRNNENNINSLLPVFSYEILQENIKKGTAVYSLKSFEKELFYILRHMTDNDLKNVPDIPDNMFSNIKKASSGTNKLENLITILKNKSVTQARIQRILLYILLGISKSDIKLSKNTMPYIRVLGMNENGKKILSSLSSNANVITSVKSFENSCTDSNLLRMLEIDKFATDVYTLAYQSDSKANLDYTTRLITI